MLQTVGKMISLLLLMFEFAIIVFTPPSIMKDFVENYPNLYYWKWFGMWLVVLFAINSPYILKWYKESLIKIIEK